MYSLLCFCLFFVYLVSASTQPNPPYWPDTVYVFDPATPAESQKIIDQIYGLNGGSNPPFNGQWSSVRAAFLFMPGIHNVVVNVGYYTSVMGLGLSPYDTSIAQVTCQNGDTDYTGGALDNFWRSAENFYNKPTTTWNNDPHPAMLWAVSQASPLRRIVVDGNLTLYQYNSGCCAGYASGGYLADSLVSGSIISGSQQQWFTRNTQMQNWIDGNWNMVFLGSPGAPDSHCSNENGAPYVTSPSTPVIAEKPFIVMSNISGKYSLAVPPVEFNKVGPTRDYSDVSLIDFSEVFVANETTTADEMNEQLAAGLHLVLSPGIYNLTGSIVVSNPNTVVLGIGLPTLVSTNGKPAMIVNATEGARVGGILFQAGPLNTTNLLVWGTNDTGSSSNPGFLYDCFARVGGTNNPNIYQVTVDTIVQIAQDNVVIDDAWLWRADHDVSGEVYNSQNPVSHGLQVFGDNVITYGLAVEHELEDLVQWYGENGQAYFFQAEFPYDVTEEQFGIPGYTGFRVDSAVTQFQGYGFGVYCYFRDYVVTVANGIVTSPSAQVTSPLTVFLSGNGQITYIINDQGAAAYLPGQPEYLCV